MLDPTDYTDTAIRALANIDLQAFAQAARAVALEADQTTPGAARTVALLHDRARFADAELRRRLQARISA